MFLRTKESVKYVWQLKTVFYFLFSRIENNMFYLLIVLYHFLLFSNNYLKKIIKTCKTIKNKKQDIKIIFKTYFKILKIH